MRELITNDMNEDQLQALARELLAGKTNGAEFAERFQALAMQSIAEAHVDLDRRRRCGFPEVIFAQGKTAETISEIASQLLAAEQPVLVTRVTVEQAAVLRDRYPTSQYNATARTVRIAAGGAARAGGHRAGGQST